MENNDLKIVNVKIRDYDENGNKKPLRDAGLWYLDKSFLNPGMCIEIGAGMYQINQAYQSAYMMTNAKQLPPKPQISIVVSLIGKR